MLTAPAPSTRTRRLPRAVLAAGLLALAAACGTAAPPPPSAAPPAAGSGPTVAGSATTVTVTMTDFKLALDKPSLTAGNYTFHAVNAGQHMHALEIEGPGIEEQKTAVVGPGQAVDLAVTLPAGTYEMYCPVGNHKAMGMELDLTVS